MKVSRMVFERAVVAARDVVRAADSGDWTCEETAEALVGAVFDAALEPNLKAPSDADVDHARTCGNKGYIPRYGCVLLEGDGE